LDSQASEMNKAELEEGPEIIDLEVIMDIKEDQRKDDGNDSDGDVVMVGNPLIKRKLNPEVKSNKMETISKKVKID
jgi:hypothetical protein